MLHSSVKAELFCDVEIVSQRELGKFKPIMINTWHYSALHPFHQGAHYTTKNLNKSVLEYML